VDSSSGKLTRGSDPNLTPEQALDALNQLRSNIVATQQASWSNVAYPLVAILNAAGYEQAEATDDQKGEHLACYGGAGGYPGHIVGRV
jgi:hypothetical protein